MVTLLTNFYPEPYDARRGELRECLRRNLDLEQIGAVHLFVEDGLTPEAALASCADLGHPKVTLVPSAGRATFNRYFAYANAHLVGQTVALANADIYFDRSLSALDDCRRRRKLHQLMICLARWDVQPDGTSKLYDVDFSQDAWIFRPPVRIQNCGFTPGIPGCENRIAWEAQHAGLKVENCARTLRAHHLHLTGLRRWTMAQRLRGPGLHVRPQTLRG